MVEGVVAIFDMRRKSGVWQTSSVVGSCLVVGFLTGKVKGVIMQALKKFFEKFFKKGLIYSF